MTKQRVMLRVTYEKLAELVGLAEDHQILYVQHDPRDQQSGHIGIVIDGPKAYQVPEGTPMPFSEFDEGIESSWLVQPSGWVTVEKQSKIINEMRKLLEEQDATEGVD